MAWRLNKNKHFSVCSYYEPLRGRVDSTFPWKAIWREKAPLKVALQPHEKTYVHS